MTKHQVRVAAAFLATVSIIGIGGTNTVSAASSASGATCTKVGTSGNDTLIGGPGNDVLCGFGGNDRLVGNGGNDVLDGGAGTDILTGGPGNDTLIGGPGNDTLTGNTGNDTASYASHASPVTATLDGKRNDGSAGETDLISSDVENLTGGTGGDTLTGNRNVNILDGGRGNDVLTGILDIGTVTGDTLTGGPGTDTANYGERTLPVWATLDGVRNDGNIADHHAADLVSTDVENLVGGTGNDRLTGNSAANRLNGGPGDDLLTGGLGADTFTGGTGTDTASYTDHRLAVNVSIDGVRNDGSTGELDLVNIDVENLNGGSANDTLTGSGAANRLFGGTGNDHLIGLGNADVMIGGAGNDTFTGGNGTDTVSYADRSLPVTASIDGVANDGPAGETDNVGLDVENLTGGSGGDTLTGDINANVLDGGLGDDTLFGDLGTNTLLGAGGNDTIVGGLDNETINGGAGVNSCDGAGGVDVISNCDVSGPVITSLTLTSPIDTSATAQDVTITATIADAGIGLEPQRISQLQILSPSTAITLDAFFGAADRTAGSAQSGTYVAHVTVPAFTEQGTWTVDSASLIDGFGNTTIYDNTSLGAIGAAVHTSFDQTGLADTLAPSITALSLSQTIIDTSNALDTQDILITAHLTDAQSGVAGADFVGPHSEVRFISPNGQQTVSMPLDQTTMTPASTPQDGIYSGTITVPTNSQQGIWQAEVVLVDNLGNTTTLIAADLVTAGLTSQFDQQGVGDGTAPQLTNIAYSPATVDTSAGSANLTITATITDDLAGLADSTFTGLPSSIQFISVSATETVRGTITNVQRTAGTALSGTYVITISMPAQSETGTWTLDVLTLTDQLGNSVDLFAADLDFALLPFTFQVA